jgi:hypothetical protein
MTFAGNGRLCMVLCGESIVVSICLKHGPNVLLRDIAIGDATAWPRVYLEACNYGMDPDCTHLSASAASEGDGTRLHEAMSLVLDSNSFMQRADRHSEALLTGKGLA